MDETELTAVKDSLQDVRDEVRRALARLDEELLTMRLNERAIQIRVENVRNAAFEALAELRHLDKQVRRIETGEGPAGWKPA